MKDFLSLVRRPTDLLKSLRRITLGGMIAAAGTGVATPASATEATPAPPNSISPTIVDRSKKAAKFVLQLPNAVGFLRAEHRSHRSHSSHRSHYSSTGGGVSAPAPAPAPPKPPVREAASVVELMTPASAATVSGEVVAVNIDARTITIRPTPTATTRQTFSYRDDSKFQSTAGVAFRFDEFADANSGRVPITTGDKVDIQWRTSTDGKTQIISSVKKKP